MFDNDGSMIVTKNIEMFFLVLLFLGVIPSFEFYLRQTELVEVKACAFTVQLTYCIDELLNWQYEHRTAITNKQRREISHLEYVFISRQVRGNRL